MRDAGETMRWLSGSAKRAWLAVPMVLVLACDGVQTDVPQGAEETVSVAGFTLTGDDESDDGFREGADLSGILDELGVDALDDDAGELPGPGEVDPEAMPGDGPDRIARTVLVTWGQPTFEPALAGTPTAWTGRVRTDLGAMKALRAVRFERRPDGTGDRLVRDEDPRTVSFATVTTVHHDGVLVRLVLPRDPRALTGNFHFETDHFSTSLPLAALVLGGQHAFEADELGNTVTIASHLPHRCPHGMTRLLWERRNEVGGVFGGKLFGRDGELAGYVVGLWGRVDGRPRMKGAVLAPDRSFRGRLKGIWVPFGPRPEGAPPIAEGDEARPAGGTFHARWLGPDDVVRGVIGGMFQVGEVPGEGSAHGFWRVACEGERPECGAEGPMPPPPPSGSCECEAGGEAGEAACTCEARPAPGCVPAEEPAPSE